MIHKLSRLIASVLVENREARRVNCNSCEETGLEDLRKLADMLSDSPYNKKYKESELQHV